MVSTDIGYACPTCGERVSTQATPTSGKETPVIVNDDFGQFSNSKNGLTANETTPPRPQIINHHSSSQYRKRLQERLSALEIPEIESPAAMPEISAPSNTDNKTEPFAANKQKNPNNNNDPSLTADEQALLHTALAESQNRDVQTHQSVHHGTAAERAEQLMRAAATQPNSITAYKNQILITVSVVVIGGAILTGWALTRAPQKPSSQTIDSVSPSATPSNQAQQARDKVRKSDLNTLSIGLESYKKNAGVYPSGSNISVLEPLTQTSPPYITKIPIDPSSKENGIIQYGYTSDGKSFTLSTVLENKSDPDTRNGVYVVKNNTSD